ncbi:MAG: hypothetical protein QF473_00725, partial [Planctomycetota bacterium]|nr:hypothetical protein [Planctomycetota bacterium]
MCRAHTRESSVHHFNGLSSKLLSLITLLASALCNAEPVSQPRHTVRVLLVDSAKPGESLRGITKSLPMVDGQRIGSAVHWPANVKLDGEPLFERYEGNRLTVRLPVRTIELAAGEHVIEPGGHKFVVGEDGKVSSGDPEFIIEGADIRLKCYPVVVQVIDGEEQGAFSARRLPGAFTVSAQVTRPAKNPKPGEPKLERIDVQLVPEGGTFAPLTLYLPSNTKGPGYILTPFGVTFHLTDGKVKIIVPEGSTPKAEVEGLDIGLPTRPVDIVLRTVKARVIKAAMQSLKMSERLQIPTPSLIKRNVTEKRFSRTISPRAVPVELFAGAGASSLRVPVDCSFTEYAHMTILAENTLTESEAASMLMVEYNDVSHSPEQRSLMRVSYVDAGSSVGMQPKTAIFVRRVGQEDAAWQKIDADSSPEFSPRHESYVKAKTDPKDPLNLSEVRGAEVSFQLPPLRLGVYDLLVALDDTEPKPNSRLAVIRPVVLIPQESAGALGFFTQKGRDAFNLGEDIRISLVAKSGKALPDGAPEVTMTGPNGGTWKLSLTAPGPERNHATFHIRLPAELTRFLNPGGYTFTAEWNSLLSAKKSIDLVDPHRPTHFLSVLPSKYSPLGATYHEALMHDFDEPDGAERIVQFAHRMGHNQIDFMHYVTDRTRRWPSLRERIYAKFPDTPPAESFYRPTPRDRILNEGVRRGVGINDTLIFFADNHAPRYVEPLLRCSERWIALEAQSMKHSPATSGITFYDELYAVALITPPGQAEAFQKQVRLAYREKFGISPAQLTKNIPRFTERPKLRRDLKVLEQYFSWYRFNEEGWADMNRRLQIASKRVLPTLRNTTRHRIWGTPGYSMDGEHGYIPAVHAPLDIGGFVTYSDNISGWPLTHAMMADVYGFDPKKPHYLTIPFSQSDDNGEYLQQNFFSGLSQKIHGAAFYQQPGLDPIGPWTRVAEGNRDLFHGIARRYGDLFLALEPGYKKVAVYHSWRAQILSPHKKFATVAHKTEGLWISCIRAGFPADMIFDPDINSGRAEDYSVILVPGIEFEQELSEDILNGLRNLIAAGKTVVVEKGSKLDIEGVVTMENTEWDEFFQPLYQATYRDDELVRTYRLTEDLTVKLRDFLGRYVPPAAGHSMTVGPDWLRYGETWYLVVSNFEDPMFSYLHRQRLVAPAVRTLTVYDKPSVCYDALEMKRVDLKPDAQVTEAPASGQKFDADLRTSNGKIYAFMKRPIGGVSLACTPAPSVADELAVRVQVMDDSGASIDGAFPIELILTDPKGRATERYRAAAPVLNEIFNIPANAAPGEWKLIVRELVAGHEATHKFKIADRQDAIKLAEDSRDVLVYDAALVKSMLGEMKEAVVPVEESMSESIGPLVAKLKTSFKANGIELRAVRPSEVEIQSEKYRKQGVYNEYSHWGGLMTWDSVVIGPKFHVDLPVILLDLGGKHKWTSHLLRYGLMLDVPSKHNPGAGRAIVVPAPMAFHYSKGTIVISSGDVVGLERGMNALLKLPGTAPKEELPAGRQRAEEVPGRRPDKELITRPTGEEKAFKNLSKASDATVRKTSTRRLAHLENIVSAIAVDPVNGRIVVGTRGYGENLFCFDMQGKKLWSRYLSEYNVRVVEITPDGKHIFATCQFDDRTYMLDAADGNIRWSLVNVPKKRIAHFYEGYGSSYSTPTIFPKARKLVLHYRDTGAGGMSPVAKRPPGSFAAIIGFDGKLEREVKIPEIQNGPVFSPDVKHFATIHVVDHKEKYQPPPKNGKKQPLIDIAVAYDHLRTYRTSDGQQVADTSLGKVGIEHYRVAWKSDTGPEVVLYGKREQFDSTGKKLDPGHAVVPPASVSGAHSSGYTIDENGIVHAVDPEGREKWKCSVRDPSPDTGDPGACLIASLGDRGVVAGTSRGRIVHIDGSGKLVWRVWLGDLNQPPGDYPSFVAEGRRNNRDISERIWPTITDREGDLDAKVKLGINRLENPSFESDTGGWMMESEKKLPLATPAQSGKHALRVGGHMVSQEVKRHVSRMATYVLEFHYQALAPQARLIAGTLIEGGERVASSVPFEGNTGEWKFGRIATKTYDNTESLAVGFYVEGGEMLLDNVRLRQVRWPSANHMQNLPLHKVKPIWVESFRIPYRGAPER